MDQPGDAEREVGVAAVDSRTVDRATHEVTRNDLVHADDAGVAE